jgi:hypothetical protein
MRGELAAIALGVVTAVGGFVDVGELVTLPAAGGATTHQPHSQPLWVGHLGPQVLVPTLVLERCAAVGERDLGRDPRGCGFG